MMSLRFRKPFSVVCAAAAAVLAAASTPAWAATRGHPAAANPKSGPGSLSGVWTNDDFKSSARYGTRDQVQMTEAGEMPPFRPEAAALMQQRLKASEDGHPFPTTLSQCLPAGMPQMMFGPKLLPIQIIESPNQVTILFESMTNYRVIRLGAKHPDELDRSFMGNSVGHWEGDTLVVDTVAVTDRTTIDPVGMPHSEGMHLVERFRRTGKDSLELKVTFDDPATFTRPWTARTVFKAQPDLQVGEYVCENNRNTAVGEVMSTGVRTPAGAR